MKINIFEQKRTSMEWKEYWEKLIYEKKLAPRIEEMNLYDEECGNPEYVEKMCHEIYKDYRCSRKKHLEDVKVDFLKRIDQFQGVHLQSSRIKALDSLLVKVITKRYENLRNTKNAYSGIDSHNYSNIITDLIGMRLIINYRGKWNDIHEEITQAFPYVQESEYEKGKMIAHPEDGSSVIAEIPTVYYANNDNIDEYKKYKVNTVLHKKGYRSVHYVISYQRVYIELQVRTIYDEAWSDCDHNYVYKQDENISHTALEQLSAILCQLTNVSNDLGETMREIFEQEEMTDIGEKKWRTTKECKEKFDKTLGRIEAACKDLKAFRDCLII